MGNLNITAAKLAEQDGRLAPFIQIDGHWFSMETKPSLLDAGFASLFEVDAETLEQIFTDTPEHGAEVPANPANGRMESMMIEGTDDAGVVALARKAAAILARADARPGSLL